MSLTWTHKLSVVSKRSQKQRSVKRN